MLAFSLNDVPGARMREQVLEVMDPYVRLEPGSRPAGARPVRIMLDMFPWFGPGEDDP